MCSRSPLPLPVMLLGFIRNLNGQWSFVSQQAVARAWVVYQPTKYSEFVSRVGLTRGSPRSMRAPPPHPNHHQPLPPLLPHATVRSWHGFLIRSWMYLCTGGDHQNNNLAGAGVASVRSLVHPCGGGHVPSVAGDGKSSGSHMRCRGFRIEYSERTSLPAKVVLGEQLAGVAVGVDGWV